MKPLVCSFHTGEDIYVKGAQRLRDSCDKHKLLCLIIELPSRGSWVENVALKGPFMRAVMGKFNYPLLWVDCDGWIESRPTLLYNTDADFAIHAMRRRPSWRPIGRKTLNLPDNGPVQELGPLWFLTGTVFVNRTQGGFQLLDNWARQCIRRPKAYQQLLLQEVWCTLPSLKTMWLPQGYCKIKRFGWAEGEVATNVIMHELASTVLKGVVRC